MNSDTERLIIIIKKITEDDKILCVWFPAENIIGYWLQFHNEGCFKYWLENQQNFEKKEARIKYFIIERKEVENRPSPFDSRSES
jgi:hypothetical protein